MKALVAEMNGELQSLLHSVLSSLELDVTLCEDAESARSCIQQGKFDLIVLDQVLPGEDGFDLCRELREHNSSPAIVVLASSRPEDWEEMLQSRPDDIIFHPIEPSMLRIRLALAAQCARERRRNRQVNRTTQALVKALETIPLGVTITDSEGKILYINPADAAMHGYAVDEVVEKNVRLFSPSAHWKWMTPGQLMETKRWKRQSVNVRKDGTLFPVQLTSEVITDDDGNVIGIVTTCEDLSDRTPQTP